MPPPQSTPPTPHPRGLKCALYVDGEPHEPHGKSDADYLAAWNIAQHHAKAFVWLSVHDPSEAELRQLARALGLSGRIVDEAIVASARHPRLISLRGYTLAVIRTARYVQKGGVTASNEIIDTSHVVVLLGDKFALTIRRGTTGELDTVRARLEARPTRLALGPWAVYHAVVERVVDGFLEIMDKFEEDIDEAEAMVLGKGTADVQVLYWLKRELVEFKRAAAPLARPLENVVGGVLLDIPDPIRRLTRELVDRHHRVMEQLLNFDDLLTSMLSTNLTQISVRQNDDMRKISAWAAIAAIPTIIAGIYGMNFSHMPELHWVASYPVSIVGMLLLVGVMYRIFRRSGWL